MGLLYIIGRGFCLLFTAGSPEPQQDISEVPTSFFCCLLSSGNCESTILQFMIYHYTTTASLDGIIRNDGIYLRATHYQHLNDKNEVAWCQESLRDLCEDLKNMPDEEFQLYYNTPYIISFCGLHDDLNMWRLYGDNGKGIMFCFDYKMMKEISKLRPETVLGRVIYSNDEERKEKYKQALEDYDIITTNDPVEDMFAACAFVKKDSYKIEHEERFAVILDKDINFQNGEIIMSESKKGIKNRMRGDELVPFLELRFPIEILKKIVIGYELNFEQVKDRIMEIFKQYDSLYQNVQIEKSTHAQ